MFDIDKDNKLFALWAIWLILGLPLRVMALPLIVIYYAFVVNKYHSSMGWEYFSHLRWRALDFMIFGLPGGFIH